LTSALREGFKGWYAAEWEATEHKASAARSLEIENRWKTFKYRDTTGPQSTEVFLAHIHWTKVELSRVQREKAEMRLRRLLNYLEHPDLTAYYEMRTAGLHYELKPNLLAGVTRSNGVPVSTNAMMEPKALVQAFWDKAKCRDGKAEKPGLTAICLDRIAVATAATNTPGALFKGKVGQGFTMAVEPGNPGFKYDAGQGPDGKPTKELDLELSFFAKASNSDNVGTVFVNLTWLEGDQDWAVTRFIHDQWLDLAGIL
jgi:hypothetical protein